MNWRALGSHATNAGRPTASPRRKGQDRFYVGRRGERSEVHVVTLRDVERLRPPGQCSDATFEWGGHAGRGGAELAFAILCHTTGRQPPDRVCASLPDAGFV